MGWVARIVLATLLTVMSPSLATPPIAPYAPPFTKDDICLAWVIHDEARGEPSRGKRAIYDVVTHRMKVRDLTACEVVKEPYQFSGYRKGMKLVADESMLQTYEKVRIMQPVAPKAEFFHAKSVKPTWAAKMKRILTIGGHYFYVPRNPLRKEQQKEKQK